MKKGNLPKQEYKLISMCMQGVEKRNSLQLFGLRTHDIQFCNNQRRNG